MENVSELSNRIQSVLQKLGRAENWNEVLLAASKTRSPAEIQSVYNKGVRHFGENYVQEAEAKRSHFPNDCTLHLIGPLQKNKVRKALELFDVIHTVDSLALAERINRIAGELGKRPKVFIQINLGNEPQKAGISENNAAPLITACQAMHSLWLVGLMVIPPDNVNPHPYFLRLKSLAAQHNLTQLSMGMSADWEIALECGSTLIRVGNLLFGTNR